MLVIMTIKAESPRKQNDSRDRLVRSAFTLFSEQGFDQVTLDEIAASAGVTKGSLYWHFKSKREVILAACQYYYRRWQRDAFEMIANGDDPRTQLRNVLKMSVEKCLFDERNRLFTTDLFVLGMRDPEVLAGWGQFFSTVHGFYVRLVQAASEAGLLKVESPSQSVDWMLSALEGIKQRAAFEKEFAIPSQVEQVVDGLEKIIVGIG